MKISPGKRLVTISALVFLTLVFYSSVVISYIPTRQALLYFFLSQMIYLYSYYYS